MKLIVEGMTCGHCERAIQQAVARRGGQARVDRAAGSVEVDGLDEATARAAVEEEGYRVVAVAADR
ncbi:heavy-metal-associated domain-containing protein [Lysobacter sp. N42]|uniref:heavy-metal-associated domain-containing protein n=1 Tax=Lysobacter sp. N42 TaxID=2545719 RepID=UPI00104F9D0F|nr:cation transporter [Lysobacter sp. N42]TCZ77605.1 copper chaperone [Lysobacter sp. N42]